MIAQSCPLLNETHRLTLFSFLFNKKTRLCGSRVSTRCSDCFTTNACFWLLSGIRPPLPQILHRGSVGNNYFLCSCSNGSFFTIKKPRLLLPGCVILLFDLLSMHESAQHTSALKYPKTLAVRACRQFGHMLLCASFFNLLFSVLRCKDKCRIFYLANIFSKFFEK